MCATRQRQRTTNTLTAQLWSAGKANRTTPSHACSHVVIQGYERSIVCGSANGEFADELAYNCVVVSGTPAGRDAKKPPDSPVHWMESCAIGEQEVVVAVVVVLVLHKNALLLPTVVDVLQQTP